MLSFSNFCEGVERKYYVKFSKKEAGEYGPTASIIKPYQPNQRANYQAIKKRLSYIQSDKLEPRKERWYHRIAHKVWPTKIDPKKLKVTSGVQVTRTFDKRPDVKAGEIEKKFKEHVPSFTRGERTALLDYSENEYRSINHDLAQGKISKQAKLISSAIKKNTTSHDIFVHTGLKFNPTQYQIDKKTSIRLHFPAFLSTSLIPNVTKDFTIKTETGIKNIPYEHHILTIKVPKGSHALYINHASDNYNNEHEKEVLLHHGAKIEINPNPKVHHDTILAQKTYNWQGKLVHDGVGMENPISKRFSRVHYHI